MLADLIAAVVAHYSLESPGVTSLVGPEFLRHEHSPPRVVFVPTRGAIDPTMRTGDTPAFAAAGTGRSLHTRKCGCEVHVWGDPAAFGGDGYRATEELLHAVLRALHRVGVGSRDVSEEAWNDDTLDVKYGREIVFSFRAYIPVPAVASRATAPDAKANITTNLLSPDGAPAATGCSGI